MIELLEHISRTKSVAKAAQIMDMSVSKAWRILRGAQQETGFDLVQSTSGGASGGSSTVTERGFSLIEAFRNMEKGLNDSAAFLLEEFARRTGL